MEIGYEYWIVKILGNTHGDTVILVSTIVWSFWEFPLLPYNMLGEPTNQFQSVQW
jgi:hypothetical protein